MTERGKSTSDQRLWELVRSVDPVAGSSASAWQDKAETLLRRVLATPRPATHLCEQRRSFGRPLVLVVVMVAVIGVGASAVGAFTVLRLLDGEPAPPEVTQELQGGSASAQVRLATSVGDIVTLYGTQMGGHDCAYLRVTSADDDFRGEGHRGVAICNPSSERPIELATTATVRTRTGWLKLVYGRVSRDAASVALRFPDGHETALAISHGYFLHELTDGEEGPVLVIARASNDQEMDRRQLPTASTGP